MNSEKKANRGYAKKVIAVYGAFSSQQMNALADVFNNAADGQVHSDLVAAIEPMMDEVNKRTRQENDPRFLAYAVEAFYTRIAAANRNGKVEFYNG